MKYIFAVSLIQNGLLKCTVIFLYLLRTGCSSLFKLPSCLLAASVESWNGQRELMNKNFSVVPLLSRSAASMLISHQKWGRQEPKDTTRGDCACWRPQRHYSKLVLMSIFLQQDCFSTLVTLADWCLVSCRDFFVMLWHRTASGSAQWAVWQNLWVLVLCVSLCEVRWENGGRGKKVKP